MWYASEANLACFSPAMKEQSMVKGIAAGMKGHKYQECAVNSCLRGEHCTEIHPPCIENANGESIILWQGLTVAKLSRKEQELLPDSTLMTLLKYIPLCRVSFGQDDSDTAIIEKVVSNLLEKRKKGGSKGSSKGSHTGGANIDGFTGLSVSDSPPIAPLKASVKQDLTAQELQALVDEIEGGGDAEAQGGGKKGKGQGKAKAKAKGKG